MDPYLGWFSESPDASKYPLVTLQGGGTECYVDICGKYNIPVRLGEENVVHDENVLDTLHHIMVKSRVGVFVHKSILYRMSCFVFGKRVVVYIGFPYGQFGVYNLKERIFRIPTRVWSRNFTFERLCKRISSTRNTSKDST